MSVRNVESGPVSAVRRFWEFYRQYVHSAVHAASAAALTIFGLLIFVDPLFAVVAIAAYVCPPIVLYALDVDMSMQSERPTSTETGAERDSALDTASSTDWEGGDGDTDSDAGDSDSDSDDGDTDSDSDDGDSDTDSDS